MPPPIVLLSAKNRKPMFLFYWNLSDSFGKYEGWNNNLVFVKLFLSSQENKLGSYLTSSED
jgi:hypothetical protein